MYNVLCTLHYVHCPMYIALCTMYNVDCTMYYVQCTLHYVLCTMHYVQCTLHYVLYTLYHVHPVKLLFNGSPIQYTNTFYTAITIGYVYCMFNSILVHNVHYMYVY